MNEFKYFIKIQKAFEDQGKWFVEGIASGLDEDRDEQVMSREVLEKFVQYINSFQLPLTDSHPRSGEVMGELGKVVYGELTPECKLFIKAEIDRDNPAVPYMIKKIQEGKRYAFSIEGTEPKVDMVWSDVLKKFIDRFIDLRPKAISITTEPSYMPSFLDVVTKAYQKSLKEKSSPESDVIAKSNLDINNTSMSTEEVKKEEETKTTETAEVVDTTADTKTSEETTVTEEVKTEAPAEEKVETAEVQTPTEVSEDVEKSVKAVEVVAKSTEEVADRDASDNGEVGDMPKNFDEVLKAIQGIHSDMKKMYGEVCGTKKSMDDVIAITKSVHEEMEVIKGLPLQKKSKIVAKSLEERKDEKLNPAQEAAKFFAA